MNKQFAYIELTLDKESCDYLHTIVETMVQGSELYNSPVVSRIHGDMTHSAHLTLFYGLNPAVIEDPELNDLIKSININEIHEEEILKDQLELLDKDLFEIMDEYVERESVESKIAKDADKLEQILLVKEYIMRGNKEAEHWINPKKRDIFYSETAKDLFDKILETDPADWWKELWTEKRR